MPPKPRANRFCAAALWWLAFLLPAVLPATPRWHVVHGEFFDVYSDAGSAETVDAAVWMEQFRRTVGMFWKIDATAIQRATIVQFRSREEFRPYHRGRYMGGFFSRSDFAAVMALCAEGDDGANRRCTQHECVHWLLAAKRAQFPLWLNEGFAELYSTFAIDGEKCSVFLADEANLRWLQSKGTVDLRRLLTVQTGGVDYNKEDQVRSFYAQSWVLTHFLMRGQGVKDGAKGLGRYLEYRGKGMEVAEAFRGAFGVELDRMEDQLLHYVTSGSYTYNKLPFARAEIGDRMRAEPASAAEVKFALGMVLLAGSRNFLEAEGRFREARDLAPGSPLPYEGFGAVACSKGDPYVAATHFKEALARGSRNTYARYLPASLELRDQLGSDPLRNQLLPADARRLSDTLRAVLAENAALARAPDELGLALLFTDPVKEDDVAFLVRCARLTEDPGVVFYRAAGLLHRLGQQREARRILETIAGGADNPRLQTAAAADLAQLDDPSGRAPIGFRWIAPPKRTASELPRWADGDPFRR